MSLPEGRLAAEAPQGAPSAVTRVGVLTVADVAAGRRLTPRQVILTYEPDQWEEFVEEWVLTLAPKYAKVERLGGANDHGVDVAAFATSRGYEGEWDCYQCKHYAKPLTPRDAYIEIAKILKGVTENHYVLPRKYRFVAPRGCGTQLSNKINHPTQLRAGFIKQLDEGAALLPGLDSVTKAKIRDLATRTDFSIFNTENLKEVLDSLVGTSLYTREFGGRLPPRPDALPLPDEIHPRENRYLEQLVEVHRERHGDQISATADALQHPEASTHIRRQRVAFYSAEALRTFSRDSVSEETFNSLQNEILEGVIEIHDGSHNSGFDRLGAVLQASMNLNFTSNALTNVVTTVDRKGMCHQLANEDKLRWCKPT
ncbi:ABC-three component system protein [Micromonospora sp. NPDC048999]|uniref:ABC-three component system protein n=1 Tax=Micromonospora sp. NPDC048999 TaxID=3155391 RepID=UPI0033D934E5